MHGILLVDKPEGITSNDVVRIVKRLVRPAKVGHSGTLDPAASGLVAVLIGAATRALEYLDEHRKSYSMTVLLGEETDTDDRDGTVTQCHDPSAITAQQIETVLTGFRGVIDQIPPHFSALKREGVPLYKLARQGIFPELAPRKVEIFSLTMRGWECPLLDMDLICSKGTYARSLARDIGRELGVGGRLDSLRRTASGAFSIEDARTLGEISAGGRDVVAGHLISLGRALAHLPDLLVSSSEAGRLVKGSSIVIPRARLVVPGAGPDDVPRLWKIASEKGGLVILVRPEPKGSEVSIQPVKVFNIWSDG